MATEARKKFRFSEDQIARAKNIDLVDMLERQGETLKKEGNVYRWMRYDSTVINGNEWFRHSRQIGGGPIQFMQHFYNMDFVDAVKSLLNGENGKEFVQVSREPAEKPVFKQPPLSKSMKRSYAYLIKTRMIDPDVVQHFVNEKKIVETKEHHNVAFCGYDENGKMKQMHLKSTMPENRFFLDVEGSDKQYYFRHVGTNEKVYVFEAPVDMLSFITMNKDNWKENSYVCLGGVAIDALKNILNSNSRLSHVHLCVDRDEAGDKTVKRISKELDALNYKWERLLPEHKDWNEDLVCIREQRRGNMAVVDSRKSSEAEKSFYVVDDLRYQQNKSRPGRGNFDIYRFDSLNEALGKFKEIPKDMTPALGMHKSERSELDLIHRREGEPVLVTDYLNFPDWRSDMFVDEVVKTACQDLNVQWQMNNKLIGNTVLIPLTNNDFVPDKVFDDKNLSPKSSFIYSNNPNPLSAINEAYVEGKGWIPFDEFRREAESFGYHNPDLLKVTRFNVNYKDNRGNAGQADISPLDLQILEERYAILFGNEQVRATALRKLAEEVDEFGEDFDYYDYHDGIEDREEHVKSLEAAFSEGKVDEIVSYLREIADENVTDHDIARALSLASRIQGLATLRRPSLDTRINGAAEKQGQNKIERPGKEPER